MSAKPSLSAQIGAVEHVVAAAKSGGLARTHPREVERELILARAAAAIESLRWLEANRPTVLLALQMIREGNAAPEVAE